MKRTIRRGFFPAIGLAILKNFLAAQTVAHAAP